MKTIDVIKNILDESRIYNIWDNTDRPGDIESGCCEYCGKKHGKSPLMVHVTYRGTCVPNDITEDDLRLVGEESQGCWAIGSTCAKKLFGKNIKKYTERWTNI